MLVIHCYYYYYSCASSSQRIPYHSGQKSSQKALMGALSLEQSPPSLHRRCKEQNTVIIKTTRISSITFRHSNDRYEQRTGTNIRPKFIFISLTKRLLHRWHNISVVLLETSSSAVVVVVIVVVVAVHKQDIVHRDLKPDNLLGSRGVEEEEKEEENSSSDNNKPRPFQLIFIMHHHHHPHLHLLHEENNESQR